jgi:hypothetical protein
MNVTPCDPVKILCPCVQTPHPKSNSCPYTTSQLLLFASPFYGINSIVGADPARAKLLPTCHMLQLYIGFCTSIQDLTNFCGCKQLAVCQILTSCFYNSSRLDCCDLLEAESMYAQSTTDALIREQLQKLRKNCTAIFWPSLVAMLVRCQSISRLRCPAVAPELG